MIVAEHFQDVKGEQQDSDGKEEEDTNVPGGGEGATRKESSGADDGPDVFEKHEDKWYVPDSQKGYNYAVECPDKTRYYKTQEGAEKRLIRHYE